MIQEKPKKILVLSTLEIRNGYPWNDRFDDQSLMHGKLRTARIEEDENEKGVLQSIISKIFKKSASPPLDIEKYYVLSKKGQILQYERWDSESFIIGIINLVDFKFSILSNQEKMKRFPGTFGFILELSHETRGKAAFGIDTLEEVNKWHKAMLEASFLKVSNEFSQVKSCRDCDETD